MGQPALPEPCKLIAGLLLSEGVPAEGVQGDLAAVFGRIDHVSQPVPWDYTAYYEAEMGPGLRRQFVSFAEPVPRDRLADLKIQTNEMERNWIESGRRRVNVDPGLLSLSSLVLASTKDHAHRIYLRDGIYAEVTLVYREGRFRQLPWTYPDYAEAVETFERMRELWNAVRRGRRHD